MVKHVSMMMAAAGLAITTLLVPATAPTAEAAGLPDLQVAYSGPTSAGPGGRFSFKVKLMDAGREATPKGKTVSFIGALPHGFKITSVQGTSAAFHCEFNNEVQIAIEPAWPLLACGTQQPIAAGDSFVVLVHAQASPQPGNYQIQLRADHNNQIPESDEGNNALNKPFIVQ